LATEAAFVHRDFIAGIIDECARKVPLLVFPASSNAARPLSSSTRSGAIIRLFGWHVNQ
jgi:hypothetical protein